MYFLAASSPVSSSKNAALCSATSSSGTFLTLSNVALTPGRHLGLHKPQEHCHMLGGPQTAFQEVGNCASHPLHLQ
jgi:hypothetical protein